MLGGRVKRFEILETLKVHPETVVFWDVVKSVQFQGSGYIGFKM